MGRLDGFEIYSRNTNGNIFISVTDYGLTFSKSSVESLDYPQYVHIFFDKKESKMAVQPCEKDNRSRVFVKNKNSKRAGFVRWNDKKLINFLIDLGNLKIGANGIRIKGNYFDDENILMFDLKNYSPIKHKEEDF